MRTLKLLLLSFLSLYIYSSANAQIVITSENEKAKDIQINKNDRIKYIQQSKKKYNGIYNSIFHGRYKKAKYGKMISHTDSSLIISSFLHKNDTVLFKNILSINKYNPLIRTGFIVVSSAGLIVFITSTAVVDSPFIIGYVFFGTLGTAIIDDFVLFPRKKIYPTRIICVK